MTITKKNALFQEFLALQTNRTKRLQKEQFLVSGVRMIDQALAHGWEVDYVLIDMAADLSNWAQVVIAQLSNQKAQLQAEEIRISSNLLRELAGKESGAEIVLVVSFKYDSVSDIAVGLDSKILLVDRPQYPGNLGTLIRSADAFGFSAVLTVGHAVDVYDPRVVRSSTGSFFSLPVVSVKSHPEVLQFLDKIKQELKTGNNLQSNQESTFQTIGTDENASENIAGLREQIKPPFCLILGNEEQGMSRSLQQACDISVKIPIRGSASSLNVASAGSILMYELSDVSIPQVEA